MERFAYPHRYNNSPYFVFPCHFLVLFPTLGWRSTKRWLRLQRFRLAEALHYASNHYWDATASFPSAFAQLVRPPCQRYFALVDYRSGCLPTRTRCCAKPPGF